MGRGRFSTAEQQTLNLVVQINSLMVIGLAAALLAARSLVMTQQVGAIMRVNICLLPLKVVLALILLPNFGIYGLAISTIATLFFQAVGYLFMLRRQDHATGLSLGWLFKLILCLGLCVSVAWGVEQTMTPGVLRLFVACALVGTAILFAGLIFNFTYIAAIKERMGVR